MAVGYIDTPNGRTALCTCGRQPLHYKHFLHNAGVWVHSVRCNEGRCLRTGMKAEAQTQEAALEQWNELVEGLARQTAARFTGAGAMGAV